MNGSEITFVLVVLAGLLVRLFVPLAVTVLIVVGLRRLDARWQAEAERECSTLAKKDMLCWKEQGLSNEEIELRAAMAEQPCWQMHLSSKGYLREDCLACEVFRSAPALHSRHSHANI